MKGELRKGVYLSLMLFWGGIGPLSLEALTLDVKNKVREKFELAACKAGLVVYLERAGVTVKETGEDFSVWLSDLQRTQKGEEITVRVEVHLALPSLATEGPSLERLVVEFRYSSQPGFLAGSPGSFDGRDATIDKIRTQLSTKAELTLAEGVVGGEALANAVLGLLKRRGYRVQS